MHGWRILKTMAIFFIFFNQIEIFSLEFYPTSNMVTMDLSLTAEEHVTSRYWHADRIQIEGGNNYASACV